MVAIWIVLVSVLAVKGSNLENELVLHPFFVEGTQSKRAHDIAAREFGNEYAIVVMLRGPESAVERQGSLLADRVDRMRGLKVVSPWTPGVAVGGMRPEPGVAALIVRAESEIDEEVADLLPPVEEQIDVTVNGSVKVSVAGFPAVAKSFIDASKKATLIGELVAIPVLLLVLMLVFRSVIAALLPVIVGGAVVAATRGVLNLLLPVTEIDLLATGVVGMMGLALGIDYSLLVVSRFREELKDDVPAAARVTMKATGRSVVPAGCGLIFAMLAAPLVLPGLAVSSAALAVGVVALLSMISAMCVVPALLTLLGPNLDRWSLRERPRRQVAPLRWSRRIASRPRAVLAITVVLLFLSSWAFRLESGAANIGFLPAGDPGRVQQEEVERAFGPGWLAPMEVIVNGRGSPITSRARLRALSAFQRRVEADPGVETMAGFAKIERGTRGLGRIEDVLAQQEQGLGRLDSGLSRMHDGAALNTRGLLAAAAGARLLGSGLGTAEGGAGLLTDSLQAASTGSGRLSDGLGRVSEGSGELAGGTAKASSGAERLADGLERAGEQTDELQGSARLLENAMRSGEARLDEVRGPLQVTEERLGVALQALQRMTTGRGDPEYAAALAAVEEANRELNGTDLQGEEEEAGPSSAGVEEGIERAGGQFGVGLYLAETLSDSSGQAKEGMRKLARGSARLDRGLRRLAAGSTRLSDGLAALSQGGQRLSPAMQRLAAGAEQLVGGLDRLEAGTGHLADGLGGGAQKSKLLTGGLRRIAMGLERSQDPDAGGFQQLRTQSPDLFQSSYFVLAGLDGSSPSRRDRLDFLLNLDRGGAYARMLVIPRDEPSSPEAADTQARLREDAADLARKTDSEVVVGGVAPAEIDGNEALRDQAPLMRIVLSLISFLILVPVVRSLTIPALAALFNLVTVSASFGLLALLFNDSLLGGPGYVETSVIPAGMIVMFGLAIDYEVFVFARMREEYVRTGSAEAALRNGLDRTAHVITGAALIMIAVFLAFSVSPLVSVRNFGVAQAIGIFIDAFIVRLIVIPAVMTRLGKWGWWAPGWLERVLPGGSPVADPPAQRAASP